MTAGRCENFYKFKVFDIENNKNLFFKECKEIFETVGIKKCSVYTMLNNETRSCKKWNKYKIYKVRLPVYNQTIATYD